MYLNRFEQRTLAWRLIDSAGPYLTDDDRTWLFVKIGAGELESALFALVGRCMRNEAVLPDDVTARLRDWLRGYAGTEVAAAFEPYIGPVTVAAAKIAYPSPSQLARDRYRHRPRRIPVGSISADTLDRMDEAFAS